MLSLEEMLKKCTLEFLCISCPMGIFGNSDELGYICWNCKKHLMENKTPPLSLAHTELQFPVIPPELADLKMIEERFFDQDRQFPHAVSPLLMYSCVLQCYQ